MDIQLNNKECYGCYLCKYICPTKSIDLKKNEEGFHFPTINSSKCIECNACVNNCLLNSVDFSNLSKPDLFDVSINNDRLKASSTSGGICASLMEKFLTEGNMVCASILNSELQCEHIFTADIKDLSKLQGSKYVTSSLDSIYEKLLSNKEIIDVLFIGTPCQVAAIKKYHKVKGLKYRLFTIDLLCHGVPSQTFFDNYIKYCEDYYQKRVVDVKFRVKSKRFNRMTSSIIFEDGTKITQNQINSEYLKMYYSCAVYRESCYSCKFATFPRQGDITVGDSFYSDKYDLKREFDYEKGVSIVSINNENGKLLLNMISDKHCLLEDDSILKYNENFIEPTSANKRKKEIILSSKNIHELNEQYNPVYLKNKFAYYMPSKLVLLIKKIINYK